MATHMIIRAKSFRSWLLANLSKNELRGLAEHGADAGWPGLVYTQDCVQLFDKFSAELWGLMVVDALDYGYQNVAEFMASWRRADMLNDFDTFRNLIVWFAAEKIARELTDD